MKDFNWFNKEGQDLLKKCLDKLTKRREVITLDISTCLVTRGQCEDFCVRRKLLRQYEAGNE